jgi:hypothetical protein
MGDRHSHRLERVPDLTCNQIVNPDQFAQSAAFRQYLRSRAQIFALSLHFCITSRQWKTKTFAKLLLILESGNIGK